MLDVAAGRCESYDDKYGVDTKMHNARYEYAHAHRRWNLRDRKGSASTNSAKDIGTYQMHDE